MFRRFAEGVAVAGMRPLTRSLLAGGLAAGVYGTWAYLANRYAGAAAAGLAALVQGSYSFALTVVLTGFIEMLVAALGRSAPALAGVVAIAAAVLFAVAFVLQWLAATPSILATILPGWIIGTAYAGAYTMSIRRGRPEIH